MERQRGERHFTVTPTTAKHIRVARMTTNPHWTEDEMVAKLGVTLAAYRLYEQGGSVLIAESTAHKLASLLKTTWRILASRYRPSLRYRLEYALRSKIAHAIYPVGR